MEFGLLAGLSCWLEEKPQVSSIQTKRRNSFARPHKQLSQLPDILETENTNEQILHGGVCGINFTSIICMKHRVDESWLKD